MPHAVPFQRIQVTELHSTFGAEIAGIDFSEPVADEVFKEVLAAITKVRYLKIVFTTSMYMCRCLLH